MKAHFPKLSLPSIAGKIKDQMDAAIISPDAKPKNKQLHSARRLGGGTFIWQCFCDWHAVGTYGRTWSCDWHWRAKFSRRCGDKFANAQKNRQQVEIMNFFA